MSEFEIKRTGPTVPVILPMTGEGDTAADVLSKRLRDDFGLVEVGAGEDVIEATKASREAFAQAEEAAASELAELRAVISRERQALLAAGKEATNEQKNALSEAEAAYKERMDALPERKAYFNIVGRGTDRAVANVATIIWVPNEGEDGRHTEVVSYTYEASLK